MSQTFTAFKIKSDGSGDGSFGDLTSETAASTGTDGLGQIYKGANGLLRIQVKSATAGVGTAAVAVAGSKGGGAVIHSGWCSQYNAPSPCGR